MEILTGYRGAHAESGFRPEIRAFFRISFRNRDRLGRKSGMNRRKILSNSEISAFCGQLSLIVKAGISLQEALLIMAEDDKNGRGGEIITKG